MLHPTGTSRLARALLALSALIALLARPSPAGAEIRKGEDPIVDRRTRGILAALPQSGLPIPASLDTDREVYLLIATGAAYLDVRILGRATVPPEQLARALERASAGSVLAGRPVDWRADDGFSAARAYAGWGHLGSRHSESTAPVGRVVDAVRRAGWVPHALIRIPLYADPGPLPLPVYHRRTYTWYCASTTPPETTLHLQGRLSAGAVAQALLFALWVPVLGLAGLVSAILVGRSERIPITTRRRLYMKLVYYPVFGAIAIHMPFAFAYLRSPRLYAVVDLWFGALSPSGVMAPILMLGPMAMMLTLPLATVVERRLFGPPPDAPALPEPSQDEQQARKRVVLLSLIPSVVGLLLITGQSFLPPSIAPAAFPVGMVIVLAGPSLVRLRMRRALASFDTKTTDEALTSRATGLARQMGVTLRRVEVLESIEARRNANAAALPGGSLRVTRRLLEVLTPAELDFALAHELAHLKGSHGMRRVALLLAAMGLFMVPQFLILSGTLRRIPDLVRSLLMLLPMAGFLLLFVGITWFSRRREREADLAALAVTGDLAAAESALAKIAQASDLPYVHEAHGYGSHPRLSKRIEALRSAARSLGILAA